MLHGASGLPEPMAGAVTSQLSAALLPTKINEKAVEQRKASVKKNRKSRKTASSEHPFLDFWDREVDQIVGTILYLLLTALSILPIAGLHSKMLFNRTYAVALSTLNRQNALVRALFRRMSGDVTCAVLGDAPHLQGR